MSGWSYNPDRTAPAGVSLSGADDDGESSAPDALLTDGRTFTSGLDDDAPIERAK